MVPARAFTPGSGAHSRAPAGAVTTPPRAMAVITATRAGIQSNRHAVPVSATEPATEAKKRQRESNGRGSASGRYHRTDACD